MRPMPAKARVNSARTRGLQSAVAETVSEAVLAAGEPTRNFLTGMVTHPARESDEEGALKMEAEQQALG